MPKIKVRDYNRRVDRHYDLTFTRRDAGGWLVTRRDTGHRLGWLYRDRETGLWEARTGGDPFVPLGMDILDKLKAQDAFSYEARQTSAASYGPVAYDAQRGEAAIKLVEYLLRCRALAVQAVDVKATVAAIAEHEKLAASYRDAAVSPNLQPGAQPIMLRAAEQEAADAAQLREQLAAAAVNA